MSASMCSGTAVGSASTRSSRVTCCTTPPCFAPGRLADELHVHGRLDRAVEAHLVEVDVRERAADRVALEVLENGVMGGRLPLDHDIDDPVEPGRPRERGAKVALADDDRPRVALAVEDAGDQPLLAEATDVARADLVGVPLGDLESDAIAGHRRRIVAAGGRDLGPARRGADGRARRTPRAPCDSSPGPRSRRERPRRGPCRAARRRFRRGGGAGTCPPRRSRAPRGTPRLRSFAGSMRISTRSTSQTRNATYVRAAAASRASPAPTRDVRSQ